MPIKLERLRSLARIDGHERKQADEALRVARHSLGRAVAARASLATDTYPIKLTTLDSSSPISTGLVK